MKCIQDSLNLATKMEFTAPGKKRSADVTPQVGGDDPSSTPGGPPEMKAKRAKKDNTSAKGGNDQKARKSTDQPLHDDSPHVEEAHGFPSTWECEGTPFPPPPWAHITEAFERKIVAKQWWEHGGCKLSMLRKFFPIKHRTKALPSPSDPNLT